MQLQINNPLSWYTYETNKVRILWRGMPQPIGIFNSAIDALNLIKIVCNNDKELKEYSIYTPDGILNHSHFN